MTATEVIIRPHAGPQEAFLASPADIVIYGGAAGGGKSFGLLLETVRHLANGRFGAVVFRRTCPEITNEGGLWDEANQLYPLLGGEPRVGMLDWHFPSGARVSFRHMQHEDDCYAWHGAQVPLLCFDELTKFTRKQFFYLLTRNRSTCGVRPYVRATTNPDAESWVREFIDWWIDEATGLPIPERDGVIRWFVRVEEQLVWADDPAELRREYPDQLPKSVTFIAADLDDNPTLLRKDPNYRANLLAQARVDRERLLGGNWNVVDADGAEWEDHPEYFEKHVWAEHWPDRFDLSAMAIDPSKGASDRSDFSAIVFGGVSGGRIYLDADIQRRSAERIVDDGLDVFLTLGPAVVGLESNTFQYLFAPLFDAACRDRGIPPLPIELLEESEPKPVRVRRLGPYLARQLLRIRRSPGGQLLYRQLRAFGLPKVHDDGPDAAEKVIRLLNRLAAGRRAAERAEPELVHAGW